MPEAITELRKLERLDLTNNDLSGYDFKNPACQFSFTVNPSKPITLVDVLVLVKPYKLL